MPFTVKAEIGATLEGLTDLQVRQIPYAIARTLTQLAKEIKHTEEVTISVVFDRPTPWTQNSVYFTPATKAQPVAWVGLKDDASKGVPASRYLQAEVFGGQRRPKRSELSMQAKGVLPVGDFVATAKGAEDPYGNIPRGLMTRILSSLQASADSLQNRALVSAMTRSAAKNLKLKKRGALAEYFVGRPGGGRLPLGVWERKGKRIRPVLLIVARPNYQIRFRFFDVAENYVRRTDVGRMFAFYLQEAAKP